MKKLIWFLMDNRMGSVGQAKGIITARSGIAFTQQGKCRMKGDVLDSVIGIYGHEYDGDLPRSREIVEQAFSCLCVTK